MKLYQVVDIWIEIKVSWLVTFMVSSNNDMFMNLFLYLAVLLSTDFSGVQLKFFPHGCYGLLLTLRFIWLRGCRIVRRLFQISFSWFELKHENRETTLWGTSSLFPQLPHYFEALRMNLEFSYDFRKILYFLIKNFTMLYFVSTSLICFNFYTRLFPSK